MKKLLALMLAVLMLLGLIGCQTVPDDSLPDTSTAGTTTTTSTPPPVPTEPSVIRFWQAGADTADATNVMNRLLIKFMKENPDIIVEYQAVPWANDPHVVFQTAIASKDVADLLIVGSPFDYVLADSGMVRSITPYIEKTVIDDLMDVFANECIYTGANADLAGEYVSMPLFGDARTLFYNKAIFDSVGVPYPDSSWTHEELLQYAEQLTGKVDGKQVYGFGTSARYSSQYITFIWNLGGNILNEDLTAPTVNNEIWREAITYYLSFYEKGLTPPGSEAMSLADMLAMFMNGEIAMMVATSDYAREISNDETFSANFGVGQMPHADHQTAFAGADVFVIPTDSANPEAAGRLINFLLQTENQLEYAKTVGFFPAVKSAAADPYYASDPVKVVFADAINNGRFYVKSGVSGGITTLLREEIQTLIGGSSDVDQFLKNVEDRITALLAEK